MAEEKEEVILEFKIDQKDAITELERTKKSIIGIREEQKVLNKAYKDGDITLDEYTKDTVRLEQILKKQTRTYNELTHQIQGTKSWTDKLKDSLKDTSQQITINGTNIGALSSKLASFANPANAAVAVVGALGAAYARSTIGAKDLAFAQNQLSEATTLITNRFAALVSSSEDGEGALTKLLNNTLNILGNQSFSIGLKAIGIDLAAIAKESKELALIAEQLEDLQREEVELRTKASDRLADNQELLTQIQAEQTSYNEKLDKSNEIISNIRRNEEEVKGSLEQQLAFVNKKLEADKANEALLDVQIGLKREIASVEKDAERRVQGIVRLQQNITEQNEKQLKIEAEKAAIEMAAAMAVKKANNISLPGEVKDLSDPSSIKDDPVNAEITKGLIDGTIEPYIDSAAALNKALDKLGKDRAKNEKENAELEVKYREAADMTKLQSASTVFDAISQLADEGSQAQKALALTAIAADTAAAVTGGIKAAQSVPFPGNIAAMAATIAAILGNIAQAKSIAGFAEGGWTGPGSKYQPVGIVHADEYVAPKHIVHSAAAQPHLRALENMRLRGYADGGLVTNSLTAEANQQLQIANILKQMPTPELSIKEVTRAQKRIAVREKATKIRNNAS